LPTARKLVLRESESKPGVFHFGFCFFLFSFRLHKKWLEFAGKGKKTLNKQEFTAWCLQQNIVPDTVTGERIFEQLDDDKNGELEFQEFVRVELLNKQNKTLEG
jgi:Ca2+-binding EF-hand superfamily protein